MTVGFRVTGRVQGVGFRAHVRHRAERLGLVGEVWNCRDGAVEGWATGTPEALDELASALWAGPGYVSGVETALGPERSGEGFAIASTR